LNRIYANYPIIEPAEASAFPVASLLEQRSGNPVYGATGLASEFKIGKIPYPEDSLQACRSEADLSAYAVGGDPVSAGLQGGLRS